MKMNTAAVDPKFLSARIVDAPAGHDVIYAAAAGRDGRIYLGLSAETTTPGLYARLLAYDPGADTVSEIADLAAILPEAAEPQRHPHSKIHTSMCAGADGKIYAVTHMTAPPVGEDYYHYWHVYNDPERCFKGSHLVIYDPAARSVRDFGIVSPKGGCRWLGYNPEREELYLTTFLTAHFMVIRLKTGEVRDLGRIAQYDFLGPCYSAAGYVFTTDCRGFILRFDPRDESIERLPLQIPNARWRESDQNGVFNLLPGPDGVKLYGAAIRGRRLFEFDPTAGRYGRLRDLGPAMAPDPGEAEVDYPFIRTMALGRDGRIYAAAHYAPDAQGNINSQAGLLRMRANIIAVDPATGGKEDYGVMQAAGLPPVLCPVAAACGRDGALYFTSWKVRPELPLQLTIFNPKGVRQTPLPAWTAPAAAPAVPPPLLSRLYHMAARDAGSVFVAAGRFLACEIGGGSRQPSLPRNACAVTALAAAPDGGVFGATSGAHSHLFYRTPLAGRLLLLNALGPGPAACRSLLVDAQGRLFAGVNGGADAAGRLYMYDAPRQAEWMRAYDDVDRGEFSGRILTPAGDCIRLDDRGPCVPGESICAMALDGSRGLIYGLSSPGGRFFIHDIASRRTEIRDIFARHIVNAGNLSRAMLCHQGSVYFSGHHGYLIRYSPADGAFTDTGMKLPCGAGREYLNHAAAFAAAHDGRVYGGASADGCLFRLDLDRLELINLGRPAAAGCLAALAIGRDGLVWGLAGGPHLLTHLVRHDPNTGDLQDCGLMRARIPKTWIIHRAETMAVGPDGELYIGENDAISHLFIYCPPVGPAA